MGEEYGFMSLMCHFSGQRTGHEKRCFYKATRLCLNVFKLYSLEVLISCLILLLIILFQDMNSIYPTRILY